MTLPPEEGAWSRPDLDDAQKLAVELRGRDLLVTAGAGTGKMHRPGRADPGAPSGPATGPTRSTTSSGSDLHREGGAGDAGADLPGAARGRAPAPPPAAPPARRHLDHPRLLRAAAARAIPRGGVSSRGSASWTRTVPTQSIDDAMRRVFHDWYRHEDRQLRSDFRGLVEMAKSFDRDGENLRAIVRRLYEYGAGRPKTRPATWYRLRTRALRPPRSRSCRWWAEMQLRLWGGARGGLPVEGVDARSALVRRLAVARLEEVATAAFDTGKMRALLRALQSVPGEKLRDCQIAGADGTAPAPGEGWLPSGTVRGCPLQWPTAPRGAKEVAGFHDLHEAAKEALKNPLVRLLPWIPADLLRDDEEQRRSLRVLAGLVGDLGAAYGGGRRRGRVSSTSATSRSTRCGSSAGTGSACGAAIARSWSTSSRT